MAIPCHDWPMRHTLALTLALLFWMTPAQAQTMSACEALSRAMGDAPGARFLASYPGASDPTLKDAAFLYDNAAVAIALVGCGERGKAVWIGDAILLALAHDRHWKDGRLRNAYLAGPVMAEPIRLPGWYSNKENRWLEDRYQASSDSGNLAWAVLALLALDDGAGDRRYRDGAARIGQWLLQQQSRTGAGGFTGGTLGHEPSPAALPWKSTEHNADLAAAFSGLARATGEARWQDASMAAAGLVRAMWNAACRCHAVGTGADGITPNRLLALDAQVWPLLVFAQTTARRNAVIATLQARLTGGAGFSYSEAARGFWTEGTAQVALLLRLGGRETEAAALLRAITAQRTASGFYNAAATSLDTGFAADSDPSQARRYFRLPHLGATAWVAMAQTRTNPFTGRRALLPN